MLDLETIRFIEMLNQLAELTKHGFRNFDENDDESFNGVLYASPVMHYNRDAWKSATGAYVVQMTTDSGKICAVYGGYSDDFAVRANINESGKWEINVTILGEPNMLIAIADGTWEIVPDHIPDQRTT